MQRDLPLTLSFSPQSRLGEIASLSSRIRLRIRLGEGTPELPAALILASPLPWGEGQGEGRNSSYNQ